MIQRNGPLTIGFLNDGIRADWSLRPWEGMRRAAEDLGVRVVLLDGDALGGERTVDRHKNGLYRLAAHGTFDALVVWKSVLSHRITEDQFTEFLGRFSQPKVIIEGRAAGWPSVDYQNYSGMAAVVRHLVRHHGFTKLGFLGMHAHHLGFQERHRAFLDVLAQEGLELDPDLDKPFLEQGTEQDNGILFEPIRGLWLKRAHEKGIQALVCVADSIALQAMHALEQQGLRVPDDLAVVGFDDFRISAMVSPAVTTVRPAWELLGRQALTLAVDLLEGRTVAPQTSLDTRLVVRQSCGCPPRVLLHADTPPPIHTEQDLEAALRGCADAAGFPQAAGLARGLVAHWKEAESPSNRLMGYLEDQLRVHERSFPDLSAWQDLITLLERFPLAGDGTFHGARVSRARALVAGYMDHAREFHRFQQEQTEALQVNLGVDLISSFGWPVLGRVLADNLPRIGIPGWDLVFFPEDSGGGGLPKRLHMLGGRAGHALDIPPVGTELVADFLPPDPLSLLPPGTSTVVQSLHFGERNLGYMVYHTGAGAQPVFEVLTRQISNAVKGTLLVQEAEARGQELRRSLEKLKATQYQLIQSEKTAVISTLVRGLSHEMNTPLGVVITAVSVQLDLLQSHAGNPLAPVLAQCATLILQNAEKGAQLVERMRSLNLEAYSGEPGWFDAEPFFRSVFQAAALKHRLMTVEFRYSAPAGTRLFGNPAVFHLIFTNLVENSLQHGFRNRAGGTVELSLTSDSPGWLDLVYSDDGHGVTAGVLGHLFEPFGSSLDNPGGQGLGTYIVQVLVTQQLEGTVTADCPEGSGLSYRIRLPRPPGDLEEQT